MKPINQSSDLLLLCTFVSALGSVSTFFSSQLSALPISLICSSCLMRSSLSRAYADGICQFWDGHINKYKHVSFKVIHRQRSDAFHVSYHSRGISLYCCKHCCMSHSCDLCAFEYHQQITLFYFQLIMSYTHGAGSEEHYVYHHTVF